MNKKLIAKTIILSAILGYANLTSQAQTKEKLENFEQKTNWVSQYLNINDSIQKKYQQVKQDIERIKEYLNEFSFKGGDHLVELVEEGLRLGEDGTSLIPIEEEPSNRKDRMLFYVMNKAIREGAGYGGYDFKRMEFDNIQIQYSFDSEKLNIHIESEDNQTTFQIPTQFLRYLNIYSNSMNEKTKIEKTYFLPSLEDALSKKD